MDRERVNKYLKTPTDTSSAREIAGESRRSVGESVAHDVLGRGRAVLRRRAVAALLRRRRHHAHQRGLVLGRRHASQAARPGAAAARGQDRGHAGLPRRRARLRLRGAGLLGAAAARGVRRQPARGAQAAARPAQAPELAVRALLALRPDHGRDSSREEPAAQPARLPQLGLAVRVARQHGPAAAPARTLLSPQTVRRGQTSHGLRCQF